jgi:hypothetical protein
MGKVKVVFGLVNVRRDGRMEGHEGFKSRSEVPEIGW